MTSPGRYIVRPHLWIEAHEPIECPRGHRVRTNASIMSHDSFVCQHRVPGSSTECGMRVFVIRWPDGRKYLAEVTPAEALHMRDRNMSPDQALTFLSSAPPRQSVA